MIKNIDIIVPVLNEEEGLEEFYRRITSLKLDANMIFIDNASTDRTLEILNTFNDIKIITHDKNEGYGGSICDGIINSTGDNIIIIDADCEYPPEAIPELVKGLENSDVVYMSRFFNKQNTNMPFLKRIGNQIISSAFNILFRQNVTDLYTGSKAFKRSALSGIQLKRKGFEHVLELAVKFSRKGIKISEIPVQFTSRQTGRSSMKHIPETIKYFYLLLTYFVFRKMS